MVVAPESEPTSLNGQGALERPLEIGRKCYIVDHPAPVADEVMVMLTGDRFGELEAGVIVGGDDAMDNARLLQHHQVSVGRALGQVEAGREDPGNRERSGRADEHVDEAPPIGGIALRMGRETGRRELVYVVGVYAGHQRER